MVQVGLDDRSLLLQLEQLGVLGLLQMLKKLSYKIDRQLFLSGKRTLQITLLISVYVFPSLRYS